MLAEATKFTKKGRSKRWDLLSEILLDESKALTIPIRALIFAGFLRELRGYVAG